jgi:glutamine synthetase
VGGALLDIARTAFVHGLHLVAAISIAVAIAAAIIAVVALRRVPAGFGAPGQSGYEAPVYLSWGRTNRSALVRVPRISAGRQQATRVELRCPDPSCNPYLAFAVMLKAGLDGIDRELPLPDAAEEDLFHVDPRARGLETLPGSLGEALAELQRDEVVAAALGPHILERFIEAKTQEWDEYRLYVSQWELDRYLPLY